MLACVVSRVAFSQERGSMPVNEFTRATQRRQPAAIRGDSLPQSTHEIKSSVGSHLVGGGGQATSIATDPDVYRWARPAEALLRCLRRLPSSFKRALVGECPTSTLPCRTSAHTTCPERKRTEPPHGPENDTDALP